MKAKYDPDSDAMYVTLRRAEVNRTEKVDENTIIDFDKDGNIIGLEFLFVKENNPNLLKCFKIEKLVV